MRQSGWPYHCMLITLLLITGGCSPARIVRLSYLKDYRAPERPTWMDEEQWTQYSKGHMQGWQMFASRWQCRIFSDGKYETVGAYIDCRLDNSAYQKGLEDGQIAACERAQCVEMALLPP